MAKVKLESRGVSQSGSNAIARPETLEARDKRYSESSESEPKSLRSTAEAVDALPSDASLNVETNVSSRPRLTSEQTWVLETHFQEESKPATKVKKRLAEQVSLPLHMVNSWYQNRRAKAKQFRRRLRDFNPHPDDVIHHNNLWPRESNEDLKSLPYGSLAAPTFNIADLAESPWPTPIPMDLDESMLNPLLPAKCIPPRLLGAPTSQGNYEHQSERTSRDYQIWDDELPSHFQEALEFQGAEEATPSIARSSSLQEAASRGHLGRDPNGRSKPHSDVAGPAAVVLSSEPEPTGSIADVPRTAPGITSSQDHGPEVTAGQGESGESFHVPMRVSTYHEGYCRKASLSDHLKVAIERVIDRPLLWWPLKEPLRPLAKGARRFSWACECRSNVYFDVPCFVESGIVDTHMASPFTTPSQQTSSSPLPLYNQSSISGQPSTSKLSTQQTLGPSEPLSGQNQSPSSTGGSGSSTQVTFFSRDGQFIYWCIETGNTYAQSVELNARSLTDHMFSHKLVREYALVKGWWHQLWTMTSCCGATFKKFWYLYDNQALVHCLSTDPELPTDPPYRYTKPKPQSSLDQHLSWVESRIGHHMREHTAVQWPWSPRHSCSPCSKRSPQDLLQYIPKKEPHGLEAKERNEGYGLQAVARIGVWRIVAMLMLWQSLSVIFLVYWLIRHPGDLQNAIAVPATTLAGYAVYLAILSKLGITNNPSH